MFLQSAQLIIALSEALSFNLKWSGDGFRSVCVCVPCQVATGLGATSVLRGIGRKVLRGDS